MLANAYHNLYQVATIVCLMAGSAFFSGSETAFFNLSRRQIRQLSTSPHRVYHLVARLLNQPSKLLSSLLLGNMIVNVLYFAMSSVLVARVRGDYGLSEAAAVGVFSFICLILFGEVLPKSLAFANSLGFAKLAALPVFVCVEAFSPLQAITKILVLEPFLRLTLGHKRGSRTISIREFRSLIDASRQKGFITADEKKLLFEVVDLGLLKVRHVVRPRVDMPACSIYDRAEKARQVMLETGLTKIPVYSKTIDDVRGIAHLRDLLLKPKAPLASCIRPVYFVPEQKTVVSLLEFFRKSQTHIAMVVDEYGGIVGSVQLGDIAEELLGPVRHTTETERIEQTGPFEYRLPGSLAVHDWADALGVDLDQMHASTLGGLVTELLGRIPKAGDVAHLRNIQFTVERMHRHRVADLILTIAPGQDNEQ